MSKNAGKPLEIPRDRVVPKVSLSVEEAAWSLGISRSKVYQLVAEGELTSVKQRGNTLFLLSDLEEFARRFRRPAKKDV